jgi:glycosyltransferase involved in cell wall biosynthesis
MRAMHVVPRIADEGSGPSYSVPRLCEALAAAGVEITLHVLSPLGQHEPSTYEIRDHPASKLFPRLGFSRSMRHALTDGASNAQILHNHSLWMMPNVYPGFVVTHTDCRLVTSPRGVFDPWARSRSKWKKDLFWLVQRRTVERTDCFHATSLRELESIRAAGFRTPTALIPNGIDLPPASVLHGSESPRRLLFLGRVHPVKGLDLLLRAWSRIAERHEDWELHVVGPGEMQHRDETKALARELGARRVLFRGAAYGADKWREFAAASVFILPTRTENFGMAVAEALASGLPVIVTQGAPWQRIDDEGCGWWVQTTSDALAATLDSVMSMDQAALAAMGARGRAWMRRDFSWERIGQMTAATYSWLVDGAPRPSWIHSH